VVRNIQNALHQVSSPVILGIFVGAEEMQRDARVCADHPAVMTGWDIEYVSG
jgi:hypothetical protein